VQIIVVDDNSDQDKVDFEHFPGLGDPFVEVIFTKEGKGAGYARNVGLTKATGKWLLFADADDFYNYCINDILDEYVNSDSDIVYFKYNKMDSAMYTNIFNTNFYNSFIYYWKFLPKKFECFLRYDVVVWSKLIKRELVNRYCILFDETYISNDVTFSYLIGFYANSIYADPRALYCYTIRKGSIRHNKLTLENYLDLIYVDGKRYRFFRKHNIPAYDKIAFIKFLIKLYFKDKTYFKKAKDILLHLKFTTIEIIKLYILYFLVYIPKRIKIKYLHRNIIHM